MRAHRPKQGPVFCGSLVCGVTVIITCLLLMGAGIGWSPSALAHAERTVKTISQGSLSSPCLSDPTDQQCTHQDPITQGCTHDAQTIAYREMRTRQYILIGIVERRYSAACHSEWGRIIEYESGNHPVTITIANDPGRSSSGKIAYSLMVFVPTLSVAPEITGDIAITTVAETQGGPSEGINIPAEPAPPL